MKRWLAHLRYFATDAWDEWRRSPGPNVLATATLGAVLFIGGIVLLVLGNARAQLERWRADVRVEVFLRDGLDAASIAEIESRAGRVNGVERVVHVTKEEALRRYRETFRDLADLPQELGTNPLPESLEIYLSKGAAAADTARIVAEHLAKAEGVETVRYDQAWLDKLLAMLAVAKWAGAFAGAAVFIATVFILAGVLRLAVYARRDEVEIMMLVGATPGFVRGPYLVGGLAQGLVACVASLTLVEVSRRAMLARTGGAPGGLLDVVVRSPLDLRSAALLLGAGLVVGFVSAWFAVRAAR